jgi:hypothetical protein
MWSSDFLTTYLAQSNQMPFQAEQYYVPREIAQRCVAQLDPHQDMPLQTLAYISNCEEKTLAKQNRSPHLSYCRLTTHHAFSDVVLWRISLFELLFSSGISKISS